MIDDLIRLGLSPKKAKRTVETFGQEHCCHALALSIERATGNQAGYFLKCAKSGVLIPMQNIEQVICQWRGGTDQVEEPEPIPQATPEQQTWKKILDDLKLVLNRSAFGWFSGSKLRSIDDDRAVIELRGQDAVKAVKTRLLEQLHFSADMIFGRVLSLEFVEMAPV